MLDDFESDTEDTQDIEDGEFRISRFRGQHAVKQKQMERQVRRSKLWLGRLRILLRIAIILGLIFGGMKLVKSSKWYIPQDAFNSLNNKSLEIIGNKIVPSIKILSELRRNDVPVEPIYMMETDDIRQSILRLEPVQDVIVRRFWLPARLQIIVKEREPIFVIAPTPDVEPVAFFATGGKLIGREYLPLDPSIETYKVLSYGIRGDDYRNWDLDKIKQIEKLAKYIEHYSQEKIEYLDYRIPNDIYVRLQTAVIRLGNIDDTIFKKIENIPVTLQQVKVLDNKIKYVDIRWNDPVIRLE